MEPKGGRVIAGKFRLEWPIGRGGMGTVWAAMHLQLDMPVAVKFMDPSAADTDGRLRFEREARAIAQLRSPHVVQVLDHGLDNGVPYIVMELLEGEDLESRLRRVRKLSIAAGARMFTQSAKALRKAHDAGIVHRDLKPNNVFLARVDDEEVVKLLDFGVAKLTWSGAQDPHSETTGQGLLLGSPCYMSPEQARGLSDIDYRSDLWSLGVILFRSITGVRPFDANTIADLIIHICTKDPPRASELLPEAPPEIDDFFFRVFQRDPDHRYQSALEMANDFDSLVRTIPGIVLPARTTTSATMSPIDVDPQQRTVSNPGIPAVVITPERALTNPAMQAVPAHMMPPAPRDSRTSHPSIPGYDPALRPPVVYGPGVPPARVSQPGLVPMGADVSAQNAYVPAPERHDDGYAHPAQDEMDAGDPSAMPEGDPEMAEPEAIDEMEDPDAVSPGEGLDGSSNTVREASAANRQLLIYTGIAGAVAVLVLISILIVAKLRFGAVAPAVKPAETQASAEDTAPLGNPPAPTSASTAADADAAPTAQPSANAGTAASSTGPAALVPASPERPGPLPASAAAAPSNNSLHPAGSSSAKKPKPNFGY